MNRITKGIKIIFALCIMTVSLYVNVEQTQATSEPYEYTSNGVLKVYSNEGTTLWAKDDTIDKTEVNKIVIGNEVTRIRPSAFAGCTNVTNVTFHGGSSLEIIASQAFYETTSLTSITFPKSLNRIEEAAFEKSGLVNVTLNEGLKTIDNRAFKKNVGLETIIIPSTVTTFERTAFAGTNLKEIYFEGNYPTEDRGFETLPSEAIIYYNFTSNGWEDKNAILHPSSPMEIKFNLTRLGTSVKDSAVTLDTASFSTILFLRNEEHTLPQNIKVRMNGTLVSEYTYDRLTGEIILDLAAIYTNPNYTLGKIVILAEAANSADIEYSLVQTTMKEYDEPLLLAFANLPASITSEDITFTIADESAHKAQIIDGKLVPNEKEVGAIKVIATIKDGIKVGEDYSKEFTLRVINQRKITYYSVNGMNQIYANAIFDLGELATLIEYPAELLPKGMVLVGWENKKTKDIYKAGSQINLEADVNLIPVLAYEIDSTFTTGSSYSVAQGEKLSFTVSGYVEHFNGLYINSKLIDPKHYTVEAGSVIITLNEEYTKLLEVGNHEIMVSVGESTPTATLSVTSAKVETGNTTPTAPTAPNTGDTTNIAQYIGFLLLSIIAIIAFVKYRNK